MQVHCLFNGCTNDVLLGSLKCAFHRHRSKCIVSHCYNQVYARNLCVGHGGRRQCSSDGCDQNARLGLFCSEHGMNMEKRRCVYEGCTRQANMNKKCVRHGGGRVCHVQGCSTFARSGGLCRRHGKFESMTPKMSTKQNNEMENLNSVMEPAETEPSRELSHTQDNKFSRLQEEEIAAIDAFVYDIDLHYDFLDEIFVFGC